VTPRAVRKLLGEVLRGDSDLDAFCLDFFPVVYRNHFGGGRNRLAKENALLEQKPVEDILSALREAFPDAVPDAEAAAPPTPLTYGALLDAAIRLDRSLQWQRVLEDSERQENVFFLLHGHSRQGLHLFVRRIHHQFTNAQRRPGAPHLFCSVPFKLGHSRAKSGEEWDERIRYALAPGQPGRSAAHLAQKARHQPLFLILGLKPLHGISPEEEEGVRQLLGETLPALLAQARTAHPVRALMAVDFDRPEESPIDAIDGGASQGAAAGAFRYCALAELKFPTWHEVRDYLLNDVSPRPLAATIARIQAEYERLARDDDATFQQLAERLDRHLMDA
jgi:hypothetical protein